MNDTKSIKFNRLKINILWVKIMIDYSKNVIDVANIRFLNKQTDFFFSHLIGCDSVANISFAGFLIVRFAYNLNIYRNVRLTSLFGR